MKKLLLVLAIASSLTLTGCDQSTTATPVSSSGVSKFTATINPGADGLTVEQRNIDERLGRDNDIGSYKHMYIISAYSGDVLIYSTVRGKVTSSPKRLSPTTVSDARTSSPMAVGIGGTNYYTKEVILDDGSYGSSVPYIYWFDSKGVYHQHYVTGGSFPHITDAPMTVGKVVINMESNSK